MTHIKLTLGLVSQVDHTMLLNVFALYCKMGYNYLVIGNF